MVFPSAAGLVGFLVEPDHALQVFALEKLNAEIDNIWPEVSSSIGQIEALYEDESFPARELAALVASKVYYQLQEYNESMVFALGAGKLFDIDRAGEYEETIVAKCIDTYIALSAMHNPPSPASTTNQTSTQLADAFPSGANGSANPAQSLTSPTTPFSQSSLPSKSLLSRENTSTWDSSQPGGGNAGVPGAHPSPLTLSRTTQKSLQAVIRQIFESCYSTGAYQHVVGIAVEARNRDILREAIVRCSQDEKTKGKKVASSDLNQTEELMEYVLDICMNVVQERGLRNEILQLILELLNDIPNPDYFAIARCVVYLDQHSMASNILQQLVHKGDGKSLAVAYQLSFDLYENGTQEFLNKVMEALPHVDVKDDEVPAANGSAVQPAGTSANGQEEANESTQLLTELEQSAGAPKTTVVTDRTKPQSLNEDESKALSSVINILRGSTSIELNLEFLFRNSHADRNVLNKVRDSLEARNSIFHTAVTFANAFMNAGTTIDTFFRDNLEWLGKAVNWSKFTATAALGVIHRGNLGQGQKLLEPYLPRDGNPSGSAYSQGGSLYALGLIYTNHGTHVLDYLRDQFRKTNEEVVQHGGALGLGVAGMGTGSEAIYEELKQVLYSDSAINGEAVGLAMGLVMLGTANYKALEDMAQYAHDTQHEKIVRGLAMGMALIMYGQQEEADELINGMLDDPDPTLRYGGIFAVALAYCGSSSNKAVRKLLHVAVSDVSDDVRRAAVMSLGFVLFRKPESVPRMVELLAESYNPHVRYGATMALGIACAGTGLDEAVDLLEPMMKDSVDFVRQGALISLAMIMVQQNEATNPKVATIRKTLGKIIGDRHEDAMCKFGCALALGIIDAGGRNCTIGLQTQTGQLNMTAIVGMAIFTQYWYWFPLTHFLSLAFTPTAIIGVDQDLEIPSFKFHSNTRPSMFDYPPEQEIKTEEVPEKVKTAVLSTTAQAKRRKQAKERQARRESMDVDMSPTTPKVEGLPEGDKMDMDENVIDTSKLGEDKDDKEGGQPAEAEKIKKKVEREKVGYDLENMSRVLPAQIKYISFPADGRYQPVKKPTGGVILLNDTAPSESKSLLEMKSKKKPAPAAPVPGQRVGGEVPQTPAHQRSTEEDSRQPAEILNAVDEGEGEAECPDDFEVESEDEGGVE